MCKHLALETNALGIVAVGRNLVDGQRKSNGGSFNPIPTGPHKIGGKRGDATAAGPDCR
jgi:hypothetical protein